MITKLIGHRIILYVKKCCRLRKSPGNHGREIKAENMNRQKTVTVGDKACSPLTTSFIKMGANPHKKQAIIPYTKLNLFKNIKPPACHLRPTSFGESVLRQYLLAWIIFPPMPNYHFPLQEYGYYYLKFEYEKMKTLQE